MRLGCSTRILVITGLFVLILFIVGFIAGPIGSKLFHLEIPENLSVSEPHVILPAEGIVHLSFFTITNTLIASWLTIIVLVVFFYFCTRKMSINRPGKLQILAEFVVESLLNFIKGAAGEKNARILFPVVATIFLYVMFNAYLALLPIFGTIGLKEGHAIVPILRAANTDINVPLSIALVAFIFIEYLGIRTFGAFPYLNTFFNTGQLKDGFKSLFKGKIVPAFSGIGLGFINLFVGCLEVLSHFIRIISFTFRLFGNMTAGEILLLIVTFLVPLIVTIPFYGLELLIGFIQALIFAGLTLVFGTIALTPHSEEEHS
jgi:F-type H+-transporting ATPase subunit a